VSQLARLSQPRQKTKEDAAANIREAIQGYVAALKEDNLPVPEEHFDAVLMAV
jgi:predicted RNase H-like HicB family nuclease